MPVARLALVAAVAATALALGGCAQPSPANDNPNPQGFDPTDVQPTIVRTPVRVPEAPPTVPLPGPTGGPPGEAPEPGVTFSPGPEGEQAETDRG